MLVCGESVTTEGGLDRIRPQVSSSSQLHVSNVGSLSDQCPVDGKCVALDCSTQHA
jgi:hypothetical protein